MANKLSRILLLIVLGLSLNACGFKLRSDDYRLPAAWQTMAIETHGNLTAHSELTRELSLRLRQTQGVTLSSGRGLPKVVLLSEGFRNPVSAIDTLGRAREYLLEYVVYYQLVDGDGKYLVKQQRIYLRQEQSFSSSSILANEQESLYLRQQLQKRAAAQIIEKLLAVVNQDTAG